MVLRGGGSPAFSKRDRRPHGRLVDAGEGSVQFHVRLIDDPSASEIRLQGREAHWSYLDDHAGHFFGRGPTFVEPGRFLSTIFFVEFANWAEVDRFISNEPHNRNGVYQDIKIWRWKDEHGRRQRDFARNADQTTWYLRGFGKPGAHARWRELRADHDACCRSHGLADFVVRGSILDEAGETWQGTAAVAALPDRAAVDAFLNEEPLYKAGLYDDFIVQQFKFGGRPGQVT
jgi:uncharacterized protein